MKKHAPQKSAKTNSSVKIDFTGAEWKRIEEIARHYKLSPEKIVTRAVERKFPIWEAQILKNTLPPATKISGKLDFGTVTDLENAVAASCAGGHIHIQIDHTPETQARIISQAIDGAEVRVTKNMNRNTKLRQSTRGATTA